jgi:hypothetical protein
MYVLLVPPLRGGTYIWTLRVHGRGAAEIGVPMRSMGTRKGIPGQGTVSVSS